MALASEARATADLRFQTTARLLLPAEYNRVFAAGKRFSGACLTLVAAKRPDSMVPRLGLALAKKQIKRAHERNRVKRHIREAFRHSQDQLVGLEFVAMARANAMKTANVALRSEADGLLLQAAAFFAKHPDYKPHSPPKAAENS
jgi:ribonuclease P protein component